MNETTEEKYIRIRNIARRSVDMRSVNSLFAKRKVIATGINNILKGPDEINYSHLADAERHFGNIEDEIKRFLGLQGR